MSQPANAPVTCVDGKGRILALERSQPIPPLLPGQAERHSCDYCRHGTTTLFAALDVKTGEVLSKYHQHHTQKEFLNFLRSIESQVESGVALHLVMDNYATHKTYSVRKWLAGRPD